MQNMNRKGSLTDPCGLYWIHLESHTDPTKEGMIGISIDPESRFRTHLKSPTLHLKNAIKSYGVENIRLTVLFWSTISDCLKQEFMLRPEDNLGWNMVAGGGLPPSQKGAKRSVETVKKISDAGKISGPKGYAGQITSKGREWWLKNVCGKGGSRVMKEASHEVRSKRTKGKVWCNDGVKDFRRYPDEVPEVYSLGRVSNKRKKL